MQKFSSKLSIFFSSKPSRKLNVQVARSISHFNWFARYDIGNPLTDIKLSVEQTNH
ncbi:hypothetical protein [Paraglaciecola sp. L3A3]|uniref:hypothetical protein n=1 Tax=Paraglaciecola sp. L3A3 TaxID=2686358 RepID=UPI00131E0C00|nr:hypothetical protein [Paraglaciecola sp. L3A3]